MKRHHRHVDTPFKPEDSRQFHAGEVLQNIEDSVFVCAATLDVSIAFLTRKHYQAVRTDLLPERLVIHWLKPIHNIVNVFEFHSKTSLSDWLCATQTCAISGKGA